MILKGCCHLRVFPCVVVASERRFVIAASHLPPSALLDVILWCDGEGPLPSNVRLFCGEGFKVALLLQDAKLSGGEVKRLSESISRRGCQFLFGELVADHY